MKELSRKVFITIFGIFAVFVFVGLVIINVQSYNREYESVKRNLDIMEEWRGRFMPPFRLGNVQGSDGENNNLQGPDIGDNDSQGPDIGDNDSQGPDIENMMIMDYEVYTVEIEDGSISRILGHGNETDGFDVESVANQIMENYSADTVKVGNLYTDSYCFNYKTNNEIVIIHISEINKKLRLFLGKTILVCLGLLILIFIISKFITKWIIKPAKDAFNRQREFIADASHELKTPLAVIMASADELNADGENERYMANIKYETDRMSKLISALLDLSKIEEGVSAVKFAEENISKIVEKQCLAFEGVAFEQGVMIESDIEENIKVNCCKEEIEKLTSTLIDNAIKHSYRDTAVKVKLKRSKNNVYIEVTNAGDSIKPGDEEKIFERFYRSDESRSRSDNRYGLGLAIAKGIALNHGGSISAKSENNRTTFKVCLPV